MSTTSRVFYTILAALVVFVPTMAHAHVLVYMDGGFAIGLAHPFSGLDHLLAMLSVGIISTQMKHRHAIWALPAIFVSAMVGGGLLGVYGVHIAGIETGIALSVVTFGAFMIAGTSLPRVIYSIAAIFGLYHGYAHGVEMPQHAHTVHFAMGFILATATLHLIGVAIGLSSKRISQGYVYLRVAGVMIVGIGLQFLFLA